MGCTGEWALRGGGNEKDRTKNENENEKRKTRNENGGRTGMIDQE